MMFYKSIAPWYDEIFPASPMQLSFIESKLGILENKNILDIGSGTGNLSLLLAKNKAKATGLELDSKMVEKANDKALGIENIQFIEANMLNIDTLFTNNTFDSVVCFGNTLVHILKEDDILSFLKKCKMVLKPNGLLLFQIINYDYILDNNLEGLPTIDNEKINFVRKYRQTSDGLISFDTKLTVKTTNEIIENSVSLFPLRKENLQNLVEKSGMEVVSFYSAFDGTPYNKKSLPLIVEIKNVV